jgi:single-strand DNA-binding protein
MTGSLNLVQLIGYVGKEPEVKTFQDGGRVANFTLATSEKWKDKQSGEPKERTQWHNIAVFNEALVEVAQKYVKKGSHLYVAGQLETRSYEKDDEKRYVTEVVLRPFNGDIKLLDKKPEP